MTAVAGEGAAEPVLSLILGILAGILLYHIWREVRRFYNDVYRKGQHMTDPNEYDNPVPEEVAQDSPVNTALTKTDMTDSVVGLIREVQFDGAKEVIRKIIAVRDAYAEAAKQRRHDANVADAVVSMQTARLDALANGDTSILKLRDQVYCYGCHTNYSEFTCDVCPTCGRDNKQK